MCEREEPEWLKGAVRIWVEDDAPGARSTPGHETVEAAWRRLFGEEIPTGPRDEADYGDTVFYLTDRAIQCTAYDGCSIWVNREQYLRLPMCAAVEMSPYALAECAEKWGGS